MVKALSLGKNRPKQEDDQKSRKKQAKREAKLMVQVEQAKKDVRKSEQKVAKARTALEEHQARLRKLEDELTQFRQASQEAAADAHSKTEQPAEQTEQPHDNITAPEATSGIASQQEAAAGESQTPSLPAEGRNDIAAPAAEASGESISSATDDTALQSSLQSPAEGRNDVTAEAQTDVASTSEADRSTPIENIPAEQSSDDAPAQVHADISVNPTPTEEELAITSGEGSIPVVTGDESAWPPPQVREELAESIAEEAKPEQTTASDEPDAAERAAQQAASENGHSETEENIAVTSGEGSIPVVTSDESAWPPPQIREELAESIAEEAKQQPKQDEDEHHQADESDAEEEAENHDEQHTESSSRPRRTTRRRTRSATQHHTEKPKQE